MLSSQTGLCWVSLGHQLEPRPGCCLGSSLNASRTEKEWLCFHSPLSLCVLSEDAAVQAWPVLRDIPKVTPRCKQMHKLGIMKCSYGFFLISVTWEGCTRGKRIWLILIWVTHVQDSHFLKKKRNSELKTFYYDNAFFPLLTLPLSVVFPEASET